MADIVMHAMIPAAPVAEKANSLLRVTFNPQRTHSPQDGSSWNRKLAFRRALDDEYSSRSLSLSTTDCSIMMIKRAHSVPLTVDTKCSEKEGWAHARVTGADTANFHSKTIPRAALAHFKSDSDHFPRTYPMQIDLMEIDRCHVDYTHERPTVAFIYASFTTAYLQITWHQCMKTLQRCLLSY